MSQLNLHLSSYCHLFKFLDGSLTLLNIQQNLIYIKYKNFHAILKMIPSAKQLCQRKILSCNDFIIYIIISSIFLFLHFLYIYQKRRKMESSTLIHLSRVLFLLKIVLPITKFFGILFITNILLPKYAKEKVPI